MFEGATVALVTPFQDGELDLEALRRLTRRMLAAGLDGLVPLGSTGEAATLSLAERRQVLETVLDETGERAFVMPGTGSNSTAGTIELTRMARDLGAHGAMVVTPYYNKPTREGLVRHYEAVARAVPIPLVLYNVPGRTGLHMDPALVARLAQIDEVVAIKEASGSVDQVTEILGACDLTVLSGDDSLTLPMMAVGAAGVVSVVANVYPTEIKTMVDAAARSDLPAARALHARLFPVVQALFAESNPAPVKCALAEQGLIRNELRLPLTPVTEATRSLIRKTLALTESGAEQAAV